MIKLYKLVAITALFSLTLIQSTQAQLVWMPAETDTLKEENLDFSIFEISLHFDIINESETANRHLSWTREILFMTEGWTSTMCDNETCYFDHVNTEFTNIEAATTEFCKVSVFPNDTPGSALIRYTWVDIQTNEEVKKLYFRFGDTPLVSSVENNMDDSDKYVLAPNLTSTYISWQSKNATTTTRNYTIIDLAGNTLASGHADAQTPIYVGDLAAGMYYFVSPHTELEGSVCLPFVKK